MSHLNILTISKEIDNLNKNILQFRGQIDHLESENNTLNNNIKDINEIKMNKLDTIDCIEEIKSDFKYLEKKLSSVNNCVKKLVSRNIDFVKKNTEMLNNFLKEQVVLNDKQINVLLFVFDCSSLQDCLLLNDKELLDFGFSHSDTGLLKRKCKEALENNTYNMDGLENTVSMQGNNTIVLNGVTGV
jgi:prefoldin subunit 5